MPVKIIDMKRNVVIVAGGKGIRMGSTIPKQFIPIGCGINIRPILMHTMSLFSDITDKIILVLPKEHISYWEKLCDYYKFECKHTISVGGESRFHSVLSGLEHTDEGAIVAIHDAVRPFLSRGLILKLFDCAEKNGSAVPYTDMIDSIRSADKERKMSFVVNRNDYVCIQTPQVFQHKLIKDAYSVEFKDSFTDDASVYEYSSGKSVCLVEGERGNMKITTAIDLEIAKLLITKK